MRKIFQNVSRLYLYGIGFSLTILEGVALIVKAMMNFTDWFLRAVEADLKKLENILLKSTRKE